MNLLQNLACLCFFPVRADELEISPIKKNYFRSMRFSATISHAGQSAKDLKIGGGIRLVNNGTISLKEISSSSSSSWENRI